MRVHALLCASQSRDSISPRLRIEIQDGGECGTEGKAQPEVVINLPSCEVFAGRVAHFLATLSPEVTVILSDGGFATQTRKEVY